VTSQASLYDTEKEFEVEPSGKVFRKMSEKEVTKVREKFILSLIKMYDPQCEQTHYLECEKIIRNFQGTSKQLVKVTLGPLTN